MTCSQSDSGSELDWVTVEDCSFAVIDERSGGFVEVEVSSLSPSSN